MSLIPLTFRRLLSRGDLPGSDGGLYNPGAWVDAAGQLHLLVRYEADYTWTKPCHAVPMTPFSDILQPPPPPPPEACFTAPWRSADHALLPIGFSTGTRLEDFRPFVWQDQVLVSHVVYRPGTGEPVRQALSKIEGNHLVRWDDWALPLPLQPIEKNWVCLPDTNGIWCVYSLDPLLIFFRPSADRAPWTLAVRQDTGLTKAFGKPLRNSTHLLPFDGGYLGFWHYILDRSYVTGAYWLDDQLRLAARTPILIDGSWVQGDVYKPGVCYVSSAIQRGEEILLFYGEGDAHTGVATIQADDLRRVLR